MVHIKTESNSIEWNAKVEKAIGLCLKINRLGTQAEVSFQFNGYQKSFEVRAFPDGWNGSLFHKINNQWFIAPTGNMEMLDKMIAYLETMLWAEESN